MLHIPVLLEETVSRLVTAPGGWYVDGTAGAGGHSAALLAAAGLDARLVALDRDREAVELAQVALAPFGARAQVVRANFTEMADVVRRAGISSVRGILLDLGVSSMQLDRAERGFSFMRESALDMRMDDRQEETAAAWLKRLSEAELADVLWRYGEEKMSRRIARAVTDALKAGEPLETTTQLADLVARLKGGRRGRIHPATQTFQAIRMALNAELAALEKTLPLALDLLEPGGRLAVISFHSLEDRMVKQFMSAHEGRMESLAKGGTRWTGSLPRARRVQRKAVMASEEEVARNPRSRTAKLRVLERMD
ncbi:MAG: 16S rRNA (cytosine(1402)-N(4))-methyltransferase RsmH [Verrucomicrobiota bacterium]|jgi:16S rRNA (cytosine1402-N4)-methyltransferase|nr:16S rRNA (cytosine(1402)-N(4))-methyltransferase RsmH [Verrucomicrobiota bacterium]